MTTRVFSFLQKMQFHKKVFLSAKYLANKMLPTNIPTNNCPQISTQQKGGPLPEVKCPPWFSPSLNYSTSKNQDGMRNIRKQNSEGEICHSLRYLQLVIWHRYNLPKFPLLCFCLSPNEKSPSLYLHHIVAGGKKPTIPTNLLTSIKKFYKVQETQKLGQL